VPVTIVVLVLDVPVMPLVSVVDIVPVAEVSIDMVPVVIEVSVDIVTDVSVVIGAPVSVVVMFSSFLQETAKRTRSITARTANVFFI